MKNKKYDLVISLGAHCPVADALKRTKITEKTYPFDWSAYFLNDISQKLLVNCNLIKNHFKDAFNFEDFVEYQISLPEFRGVKNIKTCIRYHHDFPWEKSVKDFFPEFLEKYQRRVKRLYDDIETAKNILFIYNDETGMLPIKTIKDAIKILKESFPGKNINLLVLVSIATSEKTEGQEINLNIDNVRVFACKKIDSENCPYIDRIYNVSKNISKIFNNKYYVFRCDKDIVFYGLSGIEPFGRWSKDETVFFRLNTASKAKKVVVEMTVLPFINEKQPMQKAKIICNGHDITEIVFDTPGKQKINLVVPNDNNGDLDFIFEFDNPQSPKELGLSSDDRKLALGFVDAIITEKQG